MTVTTKIEEFDSVSIKNASIQFIKKGKQEAGTKFGCVGNVEGETEVIEILKKCGPQVQKKKVKASQMNMTVSAHIPVQVARDFFGLSTEGLKPGIWAYGSLSKGNDFIFTADVIDEFEDIVKMIAFTNCSNSTGFKISIENGADELAMLELEFTALADKLNNFYYEALVDELEDKEIANKWHTQFTPELVAVTTTPTP
ncbi:TPA: phage tail protein [Bacillus cereus]|nr:phage tail protein [Bacillus cereus]